MTALKDIQDHLSKVEGGGDRRRGRGRDREKNVTTKPADEERKPCKHCGKPHIQPDNKCWKLDANKNDRPKWLKVNGM